MRLSIDDIVDATAKRTKRVVKLSDPSVVSHVTEFISTQCLPLDIVLGGGIPVGRLTEIYGDTSTGKTLLAQHILAEAQRMGGVAALLDSETAIDERLATALGINTEELIYSIPETVEEAYEDIMAIVEARNKVAPDKLLTIVWDSVAATSADTEIEKVGREGLGAHTVATHARLISKMCRVMKKTWARQRIALVLINQTRTKIGVQFGDDKATFGGRAIGYYASVRLEMAHRGKLRDRDKYRGIKVRAYVAKNKVAPPFGIVKLPIVFDGGIDEVEAMLWWLKDEKIVTTRGAWSYLQFGEEEVAFQSKSWPETWEEHQTEILKMLGIVIEEENADVSN